MIEKLDDRVKQGGHVTLYLRWEDGWQFDSAGQEYPAGVGQVGGIGRGYDPTPEELVALADALLAKAGAERRYTLAEVLAAVRTGYDAAMDPDGPITTDAVVSAVERALAGGRP